MYFINLLPVPPVHISLKDSSYKIAIGLTTEPVPPTTTNGAMTMEKQSRWMSIVRIYAFS
jgi:hypothetical protein